MYRETHREIYTCGDSYRDIYSQGDIFAWGDTYAQGDTYMRTHAWRDIYRGCMLRDACTGTHTWGHMHRGNTGKYAWRIYTWGDTYA